MNASDWQQFRLGDLFSLQHGYAFKGQFFSDEGEYVLLTPGNFQEDGGLKLKGEKEKFYTAQPPEGFVLRKGDMLVAMTDLTQEAPILGSVLIVPKNNYFLHNQRLGKVVELRTDRVAPAFLYYLLNTNSVRNMIKGSASGATVRHTSPSRIAELEVRIPPLTLQRTIAGFLSAYDELIASNLRRIQILEQMARALYREWFVELRFPGHESARLVASPLGDVPEGWEVKRLGELAEEMRRSVPKGELDEPTPSVGLEHIPRRSLALDNWETVNMLGSNKLAFKKGEILFGKIRPYFHKVSVAPFDGVCSADTIVVRPLDPRNYAVVVACVSSDDFVAHATATSNGSKMPRANWHVLQNYKVLVPHGEAAHRFLSIVTDALELQQTLIFQNDNLRRTRDLLLPRLMSGELTLDEAAA